MPYWGSGPVDNDYAFDAVSSYVFMIKERMFQDAEKVIIKEYPEQSIIASLQCLRLLAKQFPKCIKVHFRKKEFQKAKEEFQRWYNSAKELLPCDYSESIWTNAELEFELFESEVINGMS